MSTQEETNQGRDLSSYLQKAALLQREAATEFSRALTLAKRAVARGKPELAIDWCHYAATVTWVSNPGFFYCHEMEQLLSEIGRRYLKPFTTPTPPMGTPKRFLHVLTTAFETGGHTRVVSRWIENCAQHAPSEKHSVLISNQGEEPLPEWLARSTHRTGGDLLQLPPMPSWLRTAAEIRTKSLEFDAIVLHIHPNDPLPNLAFNDKPKPVIFFNHADAAFTLGMDVARVVADFRPIGHDLSNRHRAPEPLKCLIPLPVIDDEPFPLNKTEARRKLGLPLDGPVALTLGEPFKYLPALGYSFPEALASICNGDPRVVVVAVGVSDLEDYPELEHSAGGRFRPVGLVLDPEILDLYYSAADIYLSTFPCGSITSALDAARHALPVQRLLNPTVPFISEDDPALESVLPAASNQNEYVAGVLQWLQWPEGKRADLGGRLRAAVLQEHCGAPWKKKWLDPALSALTSPPPVPPTPQGADGPDYSAGLSALGWTDSPSSMLIAATVLSIPEVDLRIRISCLWHSIWPWLFDTAHDGLPRARFALIKELVKTILPKPWIPVVGKMLRPILKRL